MRHPTPHASPHNRRIDWMKVCYCCCCATTTRRHSTSYACIVRLVEVVLWRWFSFLGYRLRCAKNKIDPDAWLALFTIRHSPSDGDVQRHRAFNKYIFYLIRPHDFWRDTSVQLLSHCALRACVCVVFVCSHVDAVCVFNCKRSKNIPFATNKFRIYVVKMKRARFNVKSELIVLFSRSPELWSRSMACSASCLADVLRP